MSWAFYIIFFAIVLISIIYVVLRYIDEKIYEHKLKSCDKTYIPYSNIPPLTRIIHCCYDNMCNIRCQPGDIIELIDEEDQSRIYYVVNKYGYINRLTLSQVHRLEIKYRMNIL